MDNKSIIDLHFAYAARMKAAYKRRGDPKAFREAVVAGLSQIKIAQEAAAAFHAEFDQYGDRQLPTHEGYEQLCVIYTREKRFEDAIRLAEQAKQQGWGGDWDRRISRYQKELDGLGK